MRNQTYKTDPTDNAFHDNKFTLTKREYFAAMAMQGLCADSNVTDPLSGIAITSVLMADRLIEELNK